jgi:hypothetical protein
MGRSAWDAGVGVYRGSINQFGWRDWAIDGFLVGAIIAAAITVSYLL